MKLSELIYDILLENNWSVIIEAVRQTNQRDELANMIHMMYEACKLLRSLCRE